MPGRKAVTRLAKPLAREEGRPRRLPSFVAAALPTWEPRFAIWRRLPAAAADVIGWHALSPIRWRTVRRCRHPPPPLRRRDPAQSAGLVRKFPSATTTPLVLMGYYNPLHAYGRRLRAMRGRGRGTVSSPSTCPSQRLKFCSRRRRGAASILYFRFSSPPSQRCGPPRIQPANGQALLLYYFGRRRHRHQEFSPKTK